MNQGEEQAAGRRVVGQRRVRHALNDSRAENDDSMEREEDNEDSGIVRRPQRKERAKKE